MTALEKRLIERVNANDANRRMEVKLIEDAHAFNEVRAVETIDMEQRLNALTAQFSSECDGSF